MEDKRGAAAGQSAGAQLTACTGASQTALLVAGGIPRSWLVFFLLTARLQVKGIASAIMPCWRVRMADPQPTPAGTP